MAKKASCSFVKLDEQPMDLNQSSDIDWSLCCLCQMNITERLRCPSDCKSDQTAGYKSLARDLLAFDALGGIPLSIKLNRLDNGSGIESTLITNQAKFHKSCREKFSSTQLKRLQKRKSSEGVQDKEEGDVESYSKRTRSAVDTTHVMARKQCFLCNDHSQKDDLIHASTYDLDAKVKLCASKLGDTKLLAKLSSGDVISMEAKYHKKCLLLLYSRVRAQNRQEKSKSRSTQSERIVSSVFAELISFIYERKSEEEESPIFRLRDLANLYSERIHALGVTDHVVHSSRLKDKICQTIKNFEAYKQGRHVFLAFRNDFGQTLADVCKYRGDEDAICLARAASIIREELFLQDQGFNGSFEEDC